LGVGAKKIGQNEGKRHSIFVKIDPLEPIFSLQGLMHPT